MVAKSVEAKNAIGKWQIARWWRWQNTYMVCKNMIGHYKTKTKSQNIKFNGVFKVAINRKKIRMKEKWKNWTWPNKCGKSRKGSHRSKLKVYQEQWSHKLNQITTFYIWPPIKENMTKQKWKKCTWNSILFVDHHHLNK